MTDLDDAIMRPGCPSVVYDSLVAYPYSSCYINVSPPTVVYAFAIIALGCSGYVKISIIMDTHVGPTCLVDVVVVDVSIGAPDCTWEKSCVQYA